MLKPCCFGISVHDGTKIILQLCVVTALYQFGYLTQRARSNDIFTQILLFSTPILDIIMAVVGMRAIKKGKEKLLVPFASSRLIFVIICCILLLLLPVFLGLFSLEQLVEEMKKLFGYTSDKKLENLPRVATIYLFVFKSILFYPMEEVLFASESVVACVYLSYLIILILLQSYFVLVATSCYQAIKLEEYRRCTLRYSVDTSSQDRPRYVDPEDVEEQCTPASRYAKLGVLEEKYQVSQPVATLASIN